jgi:hypothetical protein
MAVAHQPAGGRFFPCVHRGAGVSVPLGDGGVLPCPPARRPDRAGACANRPAVAECPCDLAAPGVASPSHDPGGTCLARGLWCRGVRTARGAHALSHAASPPSAPGPACAACHGPQRGPTWWRRGTDGRGCTRPHLYLARLPAAARIHLRRGHPSDRQCSREMYNGERRA